MNVIDRWNGHRWVEWNGDGCEATQMMDAIEFPPGSEMSGDLASYESGLFRARLGVAASAVGPVSWVVQTSPFRVR